MPLCCCRRCIAGQTTNHTKSTQPNPLDYHRPTVLVRHAQPTVDTLPTRLPFHQSSAVIRTVVPTDRPAPSSLPTLVIVLSVPGQTRSDQLTITNPGRQVRRRYLPRPDTRQTTGCQQTLSDNPSDQSKLYAGSGQPGASTNRPDQQANQYQPLRQQLTSTSTSYATLRLLTNQLTTTNAAASYFYSYAGCRQQQQQQSATANNSHQLTAPTACQLSKLSADNPTKPSAVDVVRQSDQTTSTSCQTAACRLRRHVRQEQACQLVRTDIVVRLSSDYPCQLARPPGCPATKLTAASYQTLATMLLPTIKPANQPTTSYLPAPNYSCCHLFIAGRLPSSPARRCCRLRLQLVLSDRQHQVDTDRTSPGPYHRRHRRPDIVIIVVPTSLVRRRR